MTLNRRDKLSHNFDVKKEIEDASSSITYQPCIRFTGQWLPDAIETEMSSSRKDKVKHVTFLFIMMSYKPLAVRKMQDFISALRKGAMNGN
jgi:hypothetical protein